MKRKSLIYARRWNEEEWDEYVSEWNRTPLSVMAYFVEALLPTCGEYEYRLVRKSWPRQGCAPITQEFGRFSRRTARAALALLQTQKQPTTIRRRSA